MSLTIQQAVDQIKAQFKTDVGLKTADTFKTGDPSQPVRALSSLHGHSPNPRPGCGTGDPFDFI